MCIKWAVTHAMKNWKSLKLTALWALTSASIHSIGFAQQTIVPAAVKPQSYPQTNYTVVLDPGHGGTEKIGGSSPNNAIGPAGSKEKDVTLTLALKTRAELARRGYHVYLTRDTDKNLGLKDRAELARDHAADVFISIHFNGNDKQTVQGTEVWVYTNCVDASKRLGACVEKRMAWVTTLRDRGLKAADYGVVNTTNHSPKTACCLAEISFMTQAQEEARLKSATYIASISSALADSVDDFLLRKTRGPAPEVIYGVTPDDINDQ